MKSKYDSAIIENNRSVIKQFIAFIFSPLLNRKSVKTKINILILSIEIIALLVFSFISTSILVNDKRTSLMDRMEKTNEKLVNDINNDFDDLIIRNVRVIEESQVFEEYTENYDVNSLAALFSKFKDLFYEISFIKIDGKEDTIVIDGAAIYDKEYSDYNTNEYFQKLRDDDQLRYILSGEFLITGLPYIQLFYKCLDKYHDVYAYLSVIFKIDTIITRIIEQKYENTGFALLANSSGIILFHPDKEKIFTKLTENGNETGNLITRVIRMEKEFVQAELNDTTGYIQYNPVNNFNWSIISVLPIQEFNKPVNNIILLSVISIICTVLLSVLIINLIMNIIIKPLFNVISKMKDISEGKIVNNDIIRTIPKDEIGILIDAFNRILLTLKNIVKQADAIADGDFINEVLNEFKEKESSDSKEPFSTYPAGSKDRINIAINVNSKGDISKAFSKMINNLKDIVFHIKELIVNLNSGSMEIESAAEEQANGANEHASGITEVSATLEELSITAKQITNNVGELVYSSEEIIKTLRENEKQLLRTVSQLEEAGIISKENTSKITALGKRSEIINDMVELIKNVANKTNILSINASIEASRSGEAGAGFSVVATEIRELSKETILSVKNAEKAAKDIHDFLNSIIISSVSESEKVLLSVHTARETSSKIEDIVTKINNNLTFTQKIDISIKQQENGSKQSATTIKQMAEIARQSVETSRNTLLVVNDLVKMSTDLEQVIQRFKTEYVKS